MFARSSVRGEQGIRSQQWKVLFHTKPQLDQISCKAQLMVLIKKWDNLVWDI